MLKTVRIEFSNNSGLGWQTVKTGLPVSAGVYTWTNLAFASTRFARWRVVDEANAAINDAQAVDFIFRNGPITYYINDQSLDDDVFTTAVGSDANLGTGPESPKATLSSVLSTHDLEPGDVVVMDTGLYSVNIDQTFFAPDSGNSTDPVFLRGSTNGIGTTLSRVTPSGATLKFSGAEYVTVEDMKIRGASIVSHFVNSDNIVFRNVDVFDAAADGLRLEGGSESNSFNGVAFYNNDENGANILSGNSDNQFGHCVFAGNVEAAVRSEGDQVYVSNSILESLTCFSSCYEVNAITNIVGDYNCLHVQEQGAVGYVYSSQLLVDRIPQWTLLSGMEEHSVNLDPVFADASAGDFHLKSVAGRYLVNNGWVLDSESSPLIDAGVFTSGYTNEPSPNGMRANIGRYGNTSSASKTSPDLHIFLSKLKYEGRVSGTVALSWLPKNIDSHTVSLQYSTNNAATWNNIAVGVMATNSVYLWDSTSVGDVPAVRLRVISENNSAIEDQSEGNFSIRNSSSSFSLYVNDASLTGDSFTSGIGNSINNQATAAAPLDSLQRLAALFDLEPGDKIFVDTGTYSATNNPTFTRSDSGSATTVPVSIIGTTNDVISGSVIDRNDTSANAYALHFDCASHFVVSNLVLKGGAIGLRLDDGENIEIHSTHVKENNDAGFSLSTEGDVLLNRVASSLNNGSGLESSSIGELKLLHSVIYSNGSAGVQLTKGKLRVTNSVIQAHGLGSFVFSLGSTVDVKSDYNNLLTHDLAFLGKLGSVGLPRLDRWQEILDADHHSLSHEPGFADPSNGDFHPLSSAGRFVQGVGYIMTDSIDSYLLDVGNPDDASAIEPDPDGSRINIGLYGATDQASMSPTNGWLIALTYNTGGLARGTNASLCWAAGGAAVAHTVSIDLSFDDGVTYSNIIAGVNAMDGCISFDASLFLSPQARWRVVSEQDGLIADTNDTRFIINSGGLTYYVNDNSTVDDQYTFGPGHVLNDGISALLPKASLEGLLQSYTLEPGDLILIDNGTYAHSASIKFDQLQSGVSTNPIIIRGVTNEPGRSSTIDMVGGPLAFEFTNTVFIQLEHVRIKNATEGVRIVSSTNLLMQNVEVKDAVTGISVFLSDDLSFSKVALAGCSGNALDIRSSDGLSFDGLVLHSNQVGMNAFIAEFAVSNSIFSVWNEGSVAYKLLNTTIVSDHNDFWLQNGAYLASLSTATSSVSKDTVSRWRRDSDQDKLSFSHEPLFVNENTCDFRLLSEAGYFSGAGFSTSLVTSVLIDGANVAEGVLQETAPHGNRKNIGLFGGTGQASRSPTNAGFVALTLNDGGRVEDTVRLNWVAKGEATNDSVKIEFSANGGISWSLLAFGLTSSYYDWDTTLVANTMLGLWRVTSISDPGVSDVTDELFAVRNSINGPINFYVNDATVIDDVYCNEVGSIFNDGLSPDDPMLSLQQVLDTYDLEPTDTVYVDSGSYGGSVNTTIEALDSGNSSNAVTIVGSTNTETPTVFNGFGIEIIRAEGISIQRITMDSPVNGLKFDNTSNIDVKWVKILTPSGHGMLSAGNAKNTSLEHCLVARSESSGFLFFGSNLTVDHCVFFENAVGISVFGSNTTIMNSIFEASTEGSFAYTLNTLGLEASMTSDYNNFYLRNGAYPVNYQAGRFQYQVESISRWTRDFDQDLHSLTSPSEFVDAGGDDFHLKSTEGSYNDSLGWVTNDIVSSLLLDSGDPLEDPVTEADPNGGRVNIGLYGGSAFGSKTPQDSTNAWLNWTHPNDGGRVEDIAIITWVAGGVVTNHTVLIEYSADGGSVWSTVAAGVAASSESYNWDTTTALDSARGVLRLTSESDGAIVDETDVLFAVRNGPLSFYINDNTLVDDTYTSSAGTPFNTGVSSNSPLSLLSILLDIYDLEPGDVVYIDSGTYSDESEVTITEFDSGDSSSPVTILGALDLCATPSSFVGSDINLDVASYVDISHLKISDANNGFLLLNSDHCNLDWNQVENSTDGINMQGSDEINITHYLALNNSAHGVNAGSLNGNVVCESSIFLNNQNAVEIISGHVTFRNNIVKCEADGQAVYVFSIFDVIAAALTADYNNIHLAPGARTAKFKVQGISLGIETVTVWSRDTGNDQHSLSHDPLFFNQGGGDYHLRSVGGRFDCTSGWTVDVLNSPLIDAGDVADDASTEPAPNGNAINIGLFGGTDEASKTSLVPGDGWLTVISLNDGGRIEAARNIYWAIGGVVTGHTVIIEYSGDDGATWQTLDSGVDANAGFLFFNTTSLADTALGVIRVTSEQNGAIFDVTDTLFSVRNNPLEFFVNDSYDPGLDHYTTAAGNLGNDGLTPATPKLSLDAVLDTYDLEGGDVVYVDSGNYSHTETIEVSEFDAGDESGNLEIIGSTNETAVTTFTFFGVPIGVNVESAPYVDIRYFNLRNANTGLRFSKSFDGKASWIQSLDGDVAFETTSSDRVLFEHCVGKGNSKNGVFNTLGNDVEFTSGVLWSNKYNVFQKSGSINVNNTILGNQGPDRFAYFKDNGDLTANYNLINAIDGAFVALIKNGGFSGGGTSLYPTVASWTGVSGQDSNSIPDEPRFADADNNDFHLMSELGRYHVINGWGQDGVSSVAIDAGDPARLYSNELEPNGNRINMGLYGGTDKASLSPTNVLIAITFNQGGRGSGLIQLNWLVGGSVTGHTVRLDYSPDGGASWLPITAGYPASAGSYDWPSSGYPSSANAYWRIASELNPFIQDTNSVAFILANGVPLPPPYPPIPTIAFFVNDDATGNDVWTTSIGSLLNSGTTPDDPLPGIQDVLDRYNLEEGDIIFVDTGHYDLLTHITFDQFDASNDPDQPIQILGTTNGVVIDRQLAGGETTALFLDRTSGLYFENITVENAAYGITINKSPFCSFNFVESRNNSSSGFNIDLTESNKFDHCLIWNCLTNGIETANSSLEWNQGVIYGNRTAIKINISSKVNVHHSLLQGVGEEGRVYAIGLGGQVTGDFNNLIRTNGARLAEISQIVGGNDFFKDLSSWVKASGEEFHSLSHQSQLANPVGGDFHLKSGTARYQGIVGVVAVQDPVFSPMIDTGNRAADYAREAAYTNDFSLSGSRINIGLYGNHEHASLSRTDKWVLAVSVNDCGVLEESHALYWTYGNMSSNEPVRLDYSDDGGIIWQAITTVPVGQEVIDWDLSSVPNTVEGRWRVIQVTDSNNVDQVDCDFIIHNDPRQYFVNDTNQFKDVFTTAVGQPANTCLTAATPCDSVLSVLQKYGLFAGDEVFIDTGTYVHNENWLLDASVTGVSNLLLTIHGSTNGTVISRNSTAQGAYGLEMRELKYVNINDLEFKGGEYGVVLDNALNTTLTRVSASENDKSGFRFDASRDNILRNSCSYANGEYGVIQVSPLSDNTILNSVLYGNGLGAVAVVGGTHTLENNIIGTAGLDNYLIEYNARFSSVFSDYNTFWTTDNSKFAWDIDGEEAFDYLISWNRATGNDLHSIYVDPAFASEGTFDYHLKSENGRYQDSSLVFDAETSWAIDAGVPSAEYASEHLPNGQRINMGKFGGTDEASLSYVGPPELFAATLADGGTATGDTELYWLYRGIDTNALVSIEYSFNDGFSGSWVPVATNVPIRVNSYIWETESFQSSPLGRWRIVLETNISVSATNGPGPAGYTNFILRAGPATYYVNDNIFSNDMYTTDVGSPDNSGLAASTPKDSLKDILDSYDLEPNDTVLVDRGSYFLTNTIQIGSGDSGALTNLVNIQGHTNYGATVFDATLNTNDGIALYLRKSKYVKVSHITVQKQQALGGAPLSAITFSFAHNCILSNVIVNSSDIGVQLLNSTNNLLERCIIANNNDKGMSLTSANENRFQQGIIWDNDGHAISAVSSIMTVSNSILHAKEIGNSVFAMLKNSKVASDYNLIHVSNGASYGLDSSNDPEIVALEGLPQWVNATTQDIHSVAADPLFFDQANLDFHVLSETRRFDPGVTNFVVGDYTNSYAIDTADPVAGTDAETEPTGDRLNIGYYGGQYEASSRSNEWIMASSGNAGGLMYGTVILVWNGKLTNSYSPSTVTLSYSPDDGATWTNIQEDVEFSDGEFVWVSDELNGSLEYKWESSPVARWKLTLDANTNLWDQTDDFFALRNEPFSYYVNDAVLDACDTYTTAPGNTNNYGVSKHAPRLSLQKLLGEIDLEAGDTIFLDAGEYAVFSNDFVFVETGDRGDEVSPVLIQGNTNYACGPGTVWTQAEVAPQTRTILTVLADYVTVSDISLNFGNIVAEGRGVTFNKVSVSNATISAVKNEKVFNEINLEDGLLNVITATNIVIRNSTFQDARISLENAFELSVKNNVICGSRHPGILIVDGSDVDIHNNTISVDGNQIQEEGISQINVQNNILISTVSESFCIARSQGILESDYNLMIATNGAWFGAQDGHWERLIYWQEATGQDLHSFSVDPRFVDPGNKDLHLKSTVGHYTDSGFVADALLSAAIDAGNPTFSLVNEPFGGGRINIGAYGNTEEASMSPTSIWFTATTINDGGVLNGASNTLRWVSRNLTPTNTLTLSYSPDGGSTWLTIVAGLASTNEFYTWDTTLFPDSHNGLWRVELQDDSSVNDEVDRTFELRNNSADYFVNDAATLGDLYTTAVGSDLNDGLTPATPKASIKTIVEEYDLQPNDVVFIDSGNYTLSEDIRLIWSDGGDFGSNVVFQGSTNLCGEKTVINRNDLLAGSHGFRFDGSHVTVSDVDIYGAHAGVFISSNRYTTIERSSFYSNSIAVVASNSLNFNIQNNLIYNNYIGGLDFINTRTGIVQNITFYSNAVFQVRVVGSSNNVVQNSAFGQLIPGAAVYAGSIADIFIDYNMYDFIQPGTFFAAHDDLQLWQLDEGHDYRSIVTNALFVDPANNDFHLLSADGRYDECAGTWVTDGVTSWGIDKGNDDVDHSFEPEDNGDRINIGAYGNTAYASKGNSAIEVLARLPEPDRDISGEDLWPLVWTVNRVATDETFRVEYSGDSGTNWFYITNGIPVYQEYVLWSIDRTNNTASMLWRITGENDTNLTHETALPVTLFNGPYQITRIQTNNYVSGDLYDVTFNGSWGGTYKVEYTDHPLTTSSVWQQVPSGPGPKQMNPFFAVNGGDVGFEDFTSNTETIRYYRVIWNNPPDGFINPGPGGKWEPNR